MGWAACFCFSLNLLRFSSLKSCDCCPVCLEAHWRCRADNSSFCLLTEGRIKSTFCSFVLLETARIGSRSRRPPRPKHVLFLRPENVLGGISKLSRILVWQSLSYPHPSHWRVHSTVSWLKWIVGWNVKRNGFCCSPIVEQLPSSTSTMWKPIK